MAKQTEALSLSVKETHVLLDVSLFALRIGRTGGPPTLKRGVSLHVWGSQPLEVLQALRLKLCRHYTNMLDSESDPPERRVAPGIVARDLKGGCATFYTRG